MKEKKAVLIILDGLGDRPSKELGGKTPLQYANTPNLEALAKRSTTGLMDPITPGVPAGSDTSHMNLLGYDPYKYYTGRGPFEAAGLDMDLEPGDIAFRCNFATVDDDMIVIDRRAGRIKEGTSELLKNINGMKIEDITVYVKPGVEHRAALVLRGPGLSPEVTDADPHETGKKVLEVLPKNPGAEKTATIVNEFIKRAHEVLKNHPINVEREKRGLKPANIILPRGAGMVPHLQKFESLHGMKGACVVGTPLIRGICKMVGIHPVDVPGATGGYDTDMIAKMNAVVKALEAHDFVLVNIKAPDIAGHDSQPIKKVEVIERIDVAIGHIMKNLPEDVVLVITADHSTPCTVGEHSGDPVPILIYSDDARPDDGGFDEISGALGSIRIVGSSLMQVIKNAANRTHKFGA